jgi:hypothetical protein
MSAACGQNSDSRPSESEAWKQNGDWPWAKAARNQKLVLAATGV